MIASNSNIYLLCKGVAKIFNSGKLAGCVVSDDLLATVEKYAAGPDKGRKYCQELAAKQPAVFKGLGFAAGYLGGIAKPDAFGQIIEMAESFGLDDKDCFWACVYEQMKYLGESEQMFDHPIVLYNADLQNTSSWANTFLDRDHHALAMHKETPPLTEEKH
jgi:hypothetical protein